MSLLSLQVGVVTCVFSCVVGLTLVKLKATIINSKPKIIEAAKIIIFEFPLFAGIEEVEGLGD